MKTKLSIVLISISLFSLACQQGSKSTSDSDDTTTVYQPSGDTSSSMQADSAIEKGMGDTAGIQGGSKVNVGADTAGQR